MKRYVICCLTSLFLLTLMSCQTDKKQEAAENQTVRSELEAGANALSSGEITYTTPEGWIKQHPSSPMRRDQFSLPGVNGGEAAELAIFFFPGEGGTVDANLKRWYGQFKQPDGSATEDNAELKTLNVDGLPVTSVSDWNVSKAQVFDDRTR